MFKPRKYQTEISNEGSVILKKRGLLALIAQVRTGKTFMSLMTAEKVKAKHVLFITKKKAISSIQNDYDTLNPSFKIQIINYESLHKIIDHSYNLIICDESHTCFVGNTKIDGVKIKDINLFDSLKTFNFDKGLYESKKVLKKHKVKLNENLVIIKCNGKEIVCTESHKIFTKRGWVEARNIISTDELQVV